jgi:DNA-directed RNA polymerase specialized sigma24 family protein
MSSAERAREYRALKKAGMYEPAPRAPYLPWPRAAEDGTELGVDLSVSAEAVAALVRRNFRAPPGVDMDDYCQEVCLRIAARNHMPSAHDPRKSSLGHYVYMVASATGANLASSESRHRGLSLQGASGAVGPSAPLEDVLAAPEPDPLPAEAELDLGVLSARGAIGPTARGYAMDCLAGRKTSEHGSSWKRGALREEIREALEGL